MFAGVFAILVVGLLAGLLLFSAGHFGPGPYYGWPFFFPFGFLIFVIGVFFVFRLAFWGWGWGSGRGYYRGYWRADAPSALEILNRRYARGDISKEQYEQMKGEILRTS